MLGVRCRLFLGDRKLIPGDFTKQKRGDNFFVPISCLDPGWIVKELDK